MSKTYQYIVPALALALALGASLPIFAGGGDRTRLRCSAEGIQDISMDAKYEARGNRVKFDTSFEALPGLGFNAGDSLEVAIGGISLGQMRLVSIGDIVGDLNFDTTAQANDDDMPLPGQFPSNVASGTSVTVGPLGCALQQD